MGVCSSRKDTEMQIPGFDGKCFPHFLVTATVVGSDFFVTGPVTVLSSPSLTKEARYPDLRSFASSSSLRRRRRSSVNFFSFMVIKLVLAQIQFVAVLIVASVVLLPFITGAALLLWWDDLLLVRLFSPARTLGFAN